MQMRLLLSALLLYAVGAFMPHHHTAKQYSSKYPKFSNGAVIQSHLQPGKVLLIRGQPTGRSNKFDFILGSGLPGSQYIQIKFDLNSKQVKVSNFLFGTNRQLAKDSSFIEKDEQHFTLAVVFLERTFEVTVRTRYRNVVYQHTFPYLFPLTKVNHLQYRGNVNVFSAQIFGKFYAVPYTAAVNVSLGKELKILGITRAPNKFSFVLLDASGGVQLAVEYNVNKQRLIASSSGGFAVEETGVSQISSHGIFEFRIMNHKDRFDVIVNEVLALSMKKIMADRPVVRLGIYGHIDVHDILVE